MRRIIVRHDESQTKSATNTHRCTEINEEIWFFCIATTATDCWLLNKFTRSSLLQSPFAVFYRFTSWRLWRRREHTKHTQSQRLAFTLRDNTRLSTRRLVFAVRPQPKFVVVARVSVLFSRCFCLERVRRHRLCLRVHECGRCRGNRLLASFGGRYKFCFQFGRCGVPRRAHAGELKRRQNGVAHEWNV